MLREKLKSRFLRPLLLLAALLALSQSSLALDFSAYGLRGSWDSSWSTTRSFNADGKLTMTYDNYEFKLHDGGWVEFNNGSMTYDTSVIEASNNNLKLKDCPSGTEVVFTLTEVNSKPYLSASWGSSSDSDYTKYGLQSDKAGWSTPAGKFNADGKLTLTSGVDFSVIKLWDTDGTWYGDSDCDYDASVFEKNDTNYALIGCPDGTSVTFTLTMNGGKPSLTASWNTPLPEHTYYLRDDWASFDAGWGSTDQRAFVADEDGNLVYTFLGLNLQTQFRVWYNDGNEHWTSPTGTNVIPSGNGENLKLNTLLKGTADITFTLSLNADGTPKNLSVTWTNVHLDETVVVPGMPFYPYGVRNESQFLAAMNEGKPYYYLLGHALNNKQPSPEWELVPGEKLFPGDARYAGKYVCDFTFTKHLDGTTADGYGDNDGNTRWVYVGSYENAGATEIHHVYTGRDLWNGLTVPQGSINNSLRLRAVYDPSLGDTDASLTIEYLRLTEDKTWEVTEVPDALPFISLVGAEWKQREGVPTNLVNIPADQSAKYDGWNTTTGGWQQSWIQYNADGEAVTNRTKTGVYFNTQWPPYHDIIFTSQFQLNGNDYEMGLSSGELTFSPSSEATGAVWKNDPRFIGQENLILDDNATYRLYEVSDLWANGKFKLWTGWSGARKNANGDGAEWEYNWNWGEYREGAEAVEIGFNQTVMMGLQNGDMVLNKPTYLSHAYFFLDVNNPRVNSACRLYTTLAPGGAQIHALSNSTYTAGVFKPELTYVLEEDTKVTGVHVVIYRQSDDRVMGEILEEDGLDVAAADFSSIFAADFASADDYAEGYFHDGFNYRNSGWYYYTMEVSFSNTTEKALVKSNPYYVQAVASTLYVGQLIKVNKENAPEELNKYDFVTYSPGAVEAYGYNLEPSEEMGEWGYHVTMLDKVPEPSFYASSEQATWTRQMLIYARRPWMGPDADESMAGSTGVKWNLSVPNAMDSPTAIQTTDDRTVEGDVPLEYVFPAPDVFRHTYSVTLTYKPASAGTDAGEIGELTTQPMTYYIAPRVPTPRMQPGRFDAIISYDEDNKDVTVSGALHTGLTNGEYTASDIEYKNTRVRRLHIKTYVDMPNATQELISLIPDDEDYSGTPANEHQLGKATRDTNFEGDERLQEYLKGTKLNLKDVTPESYIYFVNQDINRWIQYNETTGQYEAIPRKLVFDFVKNKGLVIFYERKAEGVTIEINPELQAPEIAAETPHVYRVIREKAPESNDYEELLILANTPEITPAVSKLADTELTIDTEHHDPYYAFRINGQAVGINGCDDETETNALQHHSALCKDETTCYVIQKEDLGTYWSGMGATSQLSNQFSVEVAHGYIFATSGENMDMQYYGAIFKPGQEELDPTPANAPMRAAANNAENYMVFVSVPAKADFNLTDIQTSIENVEMNAAGIVAGAGFIDMMGNEGAVYSVDGRVLYQGAGRVELPAGIYVAATASETMKVIVK